MELSTARFVVSYHETYRDGDKIIDSNLQKSIVEVKDGYGDFRKPVEILHKYYKQLVKSPEFISITVVSVEAVDSYIPLDKAQW